MQATNNKRLFKLEDFDKDLLACAASGWKGITIHHAEYITGDSKHLAFDIDEWHLERKFNGIGYHFVVERDGTVYITNRAIEGLAGAHSKGDIAGEAPNAILLGICLSLHGEEQDMTSAQSQALMKLIYGIGKRYLNVKHGWIFPHAVLQGDKKCPGWRVMKEFGIMNQFLDDGIGHR